jgi:hypothetical protein
MLVRMRYQMSGGRHDGRPWPPLGVDFEVPDWEGRDLIRGEMADPADDAARKIAESLAEQPGPGRPSKLDPRPPSQVEGEKLAAQAAAEQGDPPAVAATEEPPGELPSLAPDVADKDEAGGAGNAGENAAEDAADDIAEPSLVAGAPGPSAPKQAWIDYAVRVQGADVHAAGAMTKADLMSRYGGRL